MGADQPPNLSLPKTVISGIDNLTTDGGVVENSPDNLTLYNNRLAVRLLGNPVPHDMIIGIDKAPLNSSALWQVQVNQGDSWIPMSATSNSFHVLGTNSTGSSVVRTMTLENGQISGVLSIAYKALSTGPLKWNLEFTPNSTAQYRFVYHWNDSDITTDSQPISSTLTVSHGAANYTLSWDDVPPSMNTTLALNPGEALLITNIGTLVAGATARLDPQLLDSGPSQATAHTPQRKAVYDSKGGYYYVFYYDGMQLRYASSNNGVFWAWSYMPNGWPSWNDMYS